MVYTLLPLTYPSFLFFHYDIADFDDDTVDDLYVDDDLYVSHDEDDDHGGSATAHPEVHHTGLA